MSRAAPEIRLARAASRDAAALPPVPVEYHQLLRGPLRRWWRPLVSLLLVLAGLLVLFLVLLGAFEGVDRVLPDGWLGTLADEDSPITTLELDLVLAGLVPVSAVAVALAHRVRPGWVFSVRGRVRWRWLGRCVAVLAPVWVLYIGISFLADPPAPGRPGQWGALLVLALLVTPFQAAGEELLFRGWLTQNLGAYFARPVAGLVVSTVVSASLFALAHGSFHLWVLLDLGVFAVSASLANWWTGGLEAGIAIHVLNNVVLGVATITYGGYAESFVSEDTTGSPGSLAVSVLVQTVAVALVVWQGRRCRVERLSLPGGVPSASAELPDATWFAPLGRPDRLEP